MSWIIALPLLIQTCLSKRSPNVYHESVGHLILRQEERTKQNSSEKHIMCFKIAEKGTIPSRVTAAYLTLLFLVLFNALKHLLKYKLYLRI